MKIKTHLLLHPTLQIICSIEILSNFAASEKEGPVGCYLPFCRLFSYNYGLEICLRQQSFKVLAHINTSLTKNDTDKVLSTYIGFYDNNSYSEVTFQGYPYDLCTPSYNSGNMPVLLNSVFSGGGTGKLIVRDTAFISDIGGHVRETSTQYNFYLLRFAIDSPFGQIEIQNVFVCKGSHHLDHSSMEALIFAKNDGRNTISANLIIKNLTILDHYSHEYYSQTAGIDLMKFESVNVLLTETNIFNSSGGGAAIKASNSNITVNGSLTIVDDYSYASNGIVLELNSTLYLTEPLKATFYNKRANPGSAINSPDFNRIKILPSNNFDLVNLTRIDIVLQIMNSSSSGVNTQVYAPTFNFEWDHFQPLKPKTWDLNHTQYAYTTVIDTIFKNISDYDKFTSLANGMCVQVNGQLHWTCKYIDYSYHNRSKYIMGEKHIAVHPGGIAFSVDPMDSTRKYTIAGISDNSICFDSTVNKNSAAVIYKVYACVVNDTTRKTTYTTHVNVSLDGEFKDLMVSKLYVNASCPIGFEMMKKGYCRCQCVCMKTFNESKYTCDISTISFTAPARYWTGLDNNPSTILFGRNCPSHYCNADIGSFVLNSTLTYSSCLKKPLWSLVWSMQEKLQCCVWL